MKLPKIDQEMLTERLKKRLFEKWINFFSVMTEDHNRYSLNHNCNGYWEILKNGDRIFGPLPSGEIKEAWNNLEIEE